jgi:hypothetical protein
MADQSPRLGAPIEVPWWAFVISAPPVILILLALIDRPSLAAVAVGVLGSVFTLVVLFYITTRSRNGHVLAIYFSGIYAVWFFIAVSWAVLVFTAPTTCSSSSPPAVVASGGGCSLPSR